MLNEKIVKVFAASGAIGIGFGVLLWVQVVDVRANNEANRSEHASMRAEFAEARAESAADAKALLNVMGQILMANERTAYLQRIQCQNEAETTAELRACAKDHD